MTKIKYDGKLVEVEKIGAAELESIGISDKAIDEKYVDSDKFYWQDADGNIYETAGYVNRAAGNRWTAEDFKKWIEQ